MKIFVITLGIIVSLAKTGFSQDPPSHAKRKTPEEVAQARTEVLTKKLELDNEQKNKVYAINLEQAKNREAFKQEAREEAHKRFKGLKDSDEKLKSVLTDEQTKKYDELKKQRREQLKEKREKRHDKRQK